MCIRDRYLAKQHTKAPLTTIGAAIGGRNHATVLHSCKAPLNLAFVSRKGLPFFLAK